MSRIPITGIGVIAPGAVGIGAFRAVLDGGRTAILDIDRFDTAGLSSHRAGLVRDFKPRDYIAPMKLRRMNTLSRYAVAAARLAIDDAAATNSGTTGVALGTSFGPVQTSVEYMQEYVEKGAALAPPQLFAESVANAPGSHIAIEWGFRGFNITVTQRESSALAAAMYAASQIVKGTVDVAVIGGVEEVNEMIFSVLDRIGALAHPCDGLDEAMRPFDRRRNGLVIGEGSAVILCGATGTNARAPYAWISGFGVGRDVTASISDWGEGEGAVVETMRRAIDDAGLELRDISAVYASANGSSRGDALEYAALQKCFDDRMPPVVATKGYFGEYAAGGALQLVAAILAITDQVLHASCGFSERDPGMHFEPVRERRAANVEHVLVNSLSAGGGIVSAVLSRRAE